MSNAARMLGPGPFHADQIRDGDPYELSDGHPIYCAPAGREHAQANVSGAAVLASDPDVEWAGVDAGYSPHPGTLRAPDVAVGSRSTENGWIQGVPLLAVEYAGQGQNERDLQDKIADLLRFGTRLIWVVRLVGPRRVEVYAPGQPMRVFGVTEILQAPGILRNPVPVIALFDRTEAHRVTLSNLLQREGYRDLDAVRDEAREEGRERGMAQAVLALLSLRGLAVDEGSRQRVLACRDPERLTAWLLAAARVDQVTALFE